MMNPLRLAAAREAGRIQDLVDDCHVMPPDFFRRREMGLISNIESVKMVTKKTRDRISILANTMTFRRRQLFGPRADPAAITVTKEGQKDADLKYWDLLYPYTPVVKEEIKRLQKLEGSHFALTGKNLLMREIGLIKTEKFKKNYIEKDTKRSDRITHAVNERKLQLEQASRDKTGIFVTNKGKTDEALMKWDKI